MNVAQNHSRLFLASCFISWSIQNSVWARTADRWQWLLQSAVFAVWSDGSVISPAKRSRAEAQRSAPLHLSVHVEKRGEGTWGQKLRVFYFLRCWSGCSSDLKVIGVIPDLCLLHVKVSLSKMSNPIRAREAVLLVHEWLFLNPDWLLCHQCVKDL